MVNPRIRPMTEHDWLVASESKRGVWYHATRLSCNCPGFTRHNHCKHRDEIEKRYGRPVIRFPRQPAVALPHSDEPLTAA